MGSTTFSSLDCGHLTLAVTTSDEYLVSVVTMELERLLHFCASDKLCRV
jgi:hypothetical protein